MAKSNSDKNDKGKKKTPVRRKKNNVKKIDDESYEPRVMYNWPGFYDVLNRPKTEKEKKDYVEGMTMDGRGHEVEEYQIGIASYELSLKKFLADIKRNDRLAPAELKGQ